SFADTALRLRVARAIACLLALVLAASAQASLPDPAELRPEARQAFDRYTKLTDARNETELQRGINLLWTDALPDKERTEARSALLRGGVKIQKLQTQDGGQTIRCPGCLFHHWIAVAFIPRANVEDLLSILQDYDHQSTYYSPDVERSKLLSREGDHF